jgi:hypothetical protein
VAAPQVIEPPASATTPEAKPDLLACVMDETLSREMNELQYTRAVSEYMAASGYFADTPKVSQAAVKIMLGRDLGVSASVAMMSIHIGKSGRPSFKGELIGALLKRAGYSWKFIKHDRIECTAVPYYKNEPILDEAGKRSVVSFTYDDAKTALLTDPVGEAKHPSMYTKYGPDMLFNRMIVRLQRRFAPEVTAGIVVYTPDELEEIEERDLDAEIERKNAPGVAAVKAPEVTERKSAELKAQVEPATVTLADLVEAPALVPAPPPEGPRCPIPAHRQGSLTMPARKP